MLLAIMIIGHLLADFFFQPSILAEKKKEKISFLYLHSGIYLLLYVVFCIILLTGVYAAFTIIIFSLTHLCIDYLRVKIEKKVENKKLLFVSFMTDQIVHISIILFTYYLLDLETHTNHIYLWFEKFSGVREYTLTALLLIILLNPTAVFIKKLFTTVFETTLTEEDGNLNVGAWIGCLERIITSILILNGQYASIGLVLTAKSIARFKQLEEKDFAEKYLVGTLTSLAISLLFSIIIKSFI